MQSKTLARLCGSLLAVSAMASPLAAHHGWSGQGTAVFEVTGTVQSAVSLSGPHATMQIKDKDGQVWDLTLASPARTEEAGLKANVIPVGSTVTIRGKRSSDPKRFEVKTERVTHAGRNYDVYPDRV